MLSNPTFGGDKYLYIFSQTLNSRRRSWQTMAMNRRMHTKKSLEMLIFQIAEPIPYERKKERCTEC